MHSIKHIFSIPAATNYEHRLVISSSSTMSTKGLERILDCESAFFISLNALIMTVTLVTYFCYNSFRLSFDGVFLTCLLMGPLMIFQMGIGRMMNTSLFKEQLQRYDNEYIEPCDRPLNILASDFRALLWRWCTKISTPHQIAFLRSHIMTELNGGYFKESYGDGLLAEFDREVKYFRGYLAWRKIDGRKIFGSDAMEKGTVSKRLAEENTRLILAILSHRASNFSPWSNQVDKIPEGKERAETIHAFCLQCLRLEDDAKIICKEGWANDVFPEKGQKFDLPNHSKHSAEYEEEWLRKFCLENIKGAIPYVEYLRARLPRRGIWEAIRNLKERMGFECGCRGGESSYTQGRPRCHFFG